MTEEFLHYLWKFKNFDIKNLTTSEGEGIHIINGGIQNQNSGPDFSNAKIQIGDQIWAGNIEVHVKSSDWHNHKHQIDEAYNSVILHVVYENDKEVFLNGDKKPLPTLILKERFNEKLYWNYEAFLSNHNIIPCANQIKDIEGFLVDVMMDRVLIERLEIKTEILTKILDQTKQDWNETFHLWLARGFGLKVNSENMLDLAERLPQKVVFKHRDNQFQLESLLFGASGMLEGNSESYAKELAKEFKFLQKKYKIQSMQPVNWKFSRIRPTGFPSLRIAQLAALWRKHGNLFSIIIEVGNVKKLHSIFNCEVTEYWKNHYRFGKPAKNSSGLLGKSFINSQIINVVVPFLFLYGKIKKEPFYHHRALDLLDQLPREDNSISRKYMGLGVEINSAYRSQATIQLHDNYCALKKCLNCNIGIHLLKE